MKFIIVLTFVTLAILQVHYSAAEEFKCQEDVPYIQNECNGCFCTKTGVLGCTSKLCPQVDTQKLFNCQAGTSFEKACNKCWCVKGQGTVCTNKEC